MNIYNIQQELLTIFDEIEENGGELTPELELQLSIRQDDLKDRVKAYTQSITILDGEINTIKTEQKRLKDLVDRKQKTIDRLKNVILTAVSQFGDIKSNGVKFIDYETGSVSTRTSTSVEVDENLLDVMGKSIKNIFDYAKETNQLDVLDRIDTKTIVHSMCETVTEEDIDNVNISVNLTIPMYALVDGTGYNAMKEIFKYTDIVNIEPVVSKADLKNKLKENGSCVPNLARLVTNQSIQIK